MCFIRLTRAASCSHKLCADSVKLLTVQLDQIIPTREEELIVVTLEHSCLGRCISTYTACASISEHSWKLDMENICAVIVNCLPKIVVGQQITCFLNGKIWVESSILSCTRMYSY